MKRPFRTFLTGVILPAVLAVAVAEQLAVVSRRDLARTSDVRIAHMVLRAFLVEMNAGTDTLAPTPPDAADSAVSFVSGTTGYATALYRGARRWRSTRPPVGPRVLDPTVLHRLAGHSGGLSMPDGGILATLGPPTAGLAALAVPLMNHPRAALPTRIQIVVGLVLLFAILAGWIQLDRRGQSPPGRVSVLLLALVPTLTVMVFLVHLTAAYRSAARDATGQDLARGLAVVATHDLLDSAREVRAMTGFDATRIVAGIVESSTLGGGAKPLATLPAPPPSFTSSGKVRTSEGPAVYAAWGMPGEAVMILTAPAPVERIRAFDVRAAAIGGALGVWLVLLGGIVIRRGRRTPSVQESVRTPGGL